MTTFDKTGELIICPFCNKASTPGDWEDAELKYYATIKQKTSRIDSDPRNVSIPTDI